MFMDNISIQNRIAIRIGNSNFRIEILHLPIELLNDMRITMLISVKNPYLLVWSFLA